MSPEDAKYTHVSLSERLREHKACAEEIPISEKFEERKRKNLQSKGPDDLEFSVIFLI
jgi:hypothetical protein